jgi:hypothetical protein
LFSEKRCYCESGGTGYKCLGSSVVDVTHVEGLATSVVSIRVTFPSLVVVEVLTDSLSLFELKRLDLLEDGPSDAFCAGRRGDRSFV